MTHFTLRDIGTEQAIYLKDDASVYWRPVSSLVLDELVSYFLYCNGAVCRKMDAMKWTNQY